MAKPALGRGLGALLGGNPVSNPSALAAIRTAQPEPPIEGHERVLRTRLEGLTPCPFQPRKDFSAESLRELADSIKAQGILQPLVARERNGGLELIAGERRWRAAQLLGMAEVPVIVRQADDREVLEMALIENLQRENLNPLEEAQGFAQLIGLFQLTQEDVAAKLGKSRAAVANALRLLKLAPAIQVHLREGRISVGHAKAILGLTDEKRQLHAASRVLREGLSVRQTEGLVGHLQASDSSDRAKAALKTQQFRDANVANLESQLRERLGTKVHLRYTGGKGTLEVSFFSDAELERILQIIGVNQ